MRGLVRERAVDLDLGRTRGQALLLAALSVGGQVRRLAVQLEGGVVLVLLVEDEEPGLLIYRPHRSSKDPELFIFYEQYKDDAAFELHRKAPYLAAYRERREKEGLTQGPAEVEIYRSLTD